MRGGARAGAGRKSAGQDKKHQRPLYISDALYDSIMAKEIPGCQNFSQKCEILLNKAVWNEAIINDIQPIKPSEGRLRFIDLFAGIGGIRQGFEDDNTVAVFSSEWDKYAVETYKANYGDTPHGDITKIDASNIPKHDVLLAGFPCQPFSNIGRREGFAHTTQGTLFFDVLRILKYHMPKMFLLENVSGILNIQEGAAFKTILASLKDLGYDVFWDELDAQNYGLPQVRRRVIIVGFHPDLGIKKFELPQGDTSYRRPVNEILENNLDGYGISEYLQKSYLFKKDDGKPQLINGNSEIQVKTLVASYHKIQRLTGTFVLDGPTGIRLFSELECKRLMGFPDSFVVPVSRTQMYRQFGNSVAVPMIRAVADVMKTTLAKAEDAVHSRGAVNQSA